jgi:hypothetical protein
MIKDYIKANIAGALSDVRVERGDAKVTTEPPKDYFVYERARTYQTPSVFIIADRVDLMKQAGPNSIMANVTVRVSVVIEDVKEENLSIKAWRYQDALYEVLDQAQMVSTDGNIKLIVIVQSMLFSPVFTQNTDKKATVNAFRKEVVLECDVRHFEQP